jgi:3-oxoadipate enol-lactonase
MALHTYRAGAETKGPNTVVFLHGFPFDGSMWEPQLRALPPGWRGLAPDLRGFGRSPLGASRDEVASGSRIGGRIARPHEPVLTMDRLADDVAALIDREKTAPVVICGLSMGGYVAFSLWRRRPELVRALVLADTRPEADTDEGRENRMRMAQSARQSGARAVASAMLPTLLGDRSADERSEVAERIRSMIAATAPETLVAALAGMAVRRDSTHDLASIDVPSLVLVGAQDRLTPPDVARGMAERLRGARLVSLPGAGHVSNLENPADFNAALRDFLTTL